MTNRALFNRQYTSYTPGGTEVWLVNGAGATTTPATTQVFTAGENLIQGQAVYVSGTYALSASAASGVSPSRYNVIGFTSAAASTSANVTVVVDDIALIGSSNIAGAAQLTPGTYYYLSKYTGQISPYSTASGTVTASGGYAALVTVGQALSASELQVEVAPPVVLYD